ncbi:hypothetical protein SAMN05216466_10654 [Paraburkholderia phenazinium]|uniref:Uncharacterized protein n=1 Tax=Paraburkholderia phenazinium TaxID=60549 RepID=A0A1G7Y665_9BURK|nr:hypothetical protein [Paraburkholderia phenazinium]SDG91972.1 hypothetical protein SAMN05216466_10654 [Paraburkholderia phenazinium]
MTKQGYRVARRLLRANGRYALRWLPDDAAQVMDRLMFTYINDPLRARLGGFCQPYHPGTTAPHPCRLYPLHG